MRDCPNATMRDRLPDLINDRLSAPERAEVHAHLNSCADCRAELALLERVRSATRTPAVDVGRIASRVPAYRAAPGWRRVLASPVVGVAAALVLVAGAALMLVDRQYVEEPPVISPIVVSPQPEPKTQIPESASAPERRPRPAAAQPAELAVGAMFDDLTDAELESLLRALGSLETLTPVETEVVVPAVNRSGS